MPSGRVTIRTAEIDDAIVDAIAQGKPLAQICREIGIDRGTVYLWRNADEDFDKRIARARLTGFDAIADECFDIADDRTDEPASRRVRVETRLKLLAKWDPKRYGDKVALTGGDEGDAPIKHSVEVKFV